ncbi:BON domain-containing protein [Fuerstiella marisgermanici]|uniref:BON domain protein n=1 Tax=Fuerstiella marisgermanici TaxID=1891926 RepID=A0A1P8WM87_9PLAN|nr:BON domain-containing protein [Fuerstiella marisgermanici]APZ95164.1 BON domain protein [Fuerstiella marisgermanici]
MLFRKFAVVAATLAFSLLTPLASAQVGQLNGGGAAAGGGNAATGGGGAAGGGADAGGTTDGPGGVTTTGPGGRASQDGAVAGGNIADTFIGGNNAGGFVGGGIQTQNTSNRQFRAITNTDVPTGGQAQSTGTPRQVRVALRLAFAYPASRGTNLLMGRSRPPIQRVATVRPELRSVAVSVDAQGTAVLTGQAPNTDAARLAANLVRLRPGVRKVDNQILVATP